MNHGAVSQSFMTLAWCVRSEVISHLILVMLYRAQVYACSVGFVLFLTPFRVSARLVLCHDAVAPIVWGTVWWLCLGLRC